LLESLRTCKVFQNIFSIDIVYAKPRHHLRSVFKRHLRYNPEVRVRILKISIPS
jgi:hypothetical protein